MTTTQRAKHTSKIFIRSIAVAIVLILIGVGGYLYYRASSRPQANININGNTLQTAKATVGDLVLFASGTGTISPAAESSFGFNTSGQVTKIDVKVGDQVEAGQVLAQIDDTNAKIKLEQAQEAMDKLTSNIAIAAATQSLADAQTSFDLAKATLEHLISPEVLYWEERVAVREQILADAQTAYQTDTSDTARQKVTEAETSLKYAQTSLAYYQKNYGNEYVPATFTQYRTVKTGFGTIDKVIQITDETTGKLINLVYPPTEGEIGMARADYDFAKASIAEAQIYLNILNGADIPQGATGANLVTYIQTKHALETAEYNLNATKLIAPISGTITALNINVGDLASGSSVVTISNLDQPYALDAFLDGKEWGKIKLGYAVEVKFDIIPDRVFKGTVTDVFPTLDTSSSRSVLIHFTARLNDTQSYQLPSGSAASVDVIGGQTKNAVLVPIEALHEFGNGKYALFVVENGKIRLRVVEVGLMDLTKAEIKSGLHSGDIVTTGVVKTK